MANLTEPYGGVLVTLMADETESKELLDASCDWPSWTLTPRQMNDLELLLNGGFSPLAGFMGRGDYDSVCSSMELADGTLWPIPITLDVTEEFAAAAEPDVSIALKNPEGAILAVLTVGDIWKPDKRDEARKVYGTQSLNHPGVRCLLRESHGWYMGGRIRGIQLTHHYDFPEYRHTPSELRAEFSRLGWKKIIAFQTRNPMHRAHFEMTRKAMQDWKGNLLLHPVVGETMVGDIDAFTRVRCYTALLPRYPEDSILLSLLPLAMRMAGPREALLHGIIRRNCGCTHIIIGRDHAGPGNGSGSKPFYPPYAAQELFQEHSSRIGIEMVPYRAMVYVKKRHRYEPKEEVDEGEQTASLSGTELRARLTEGRPIPSWFTFPEVAGMLQNRYPPKVKQGFAVFFTGLSAAGKSTLARLLSFRLQEMTDRPVTLLDGDVVRKQLSSELGFSKEHRDINIRRIGFVASEITKSRGIVLCAPIAPYDSVRKEVRSLISRVGGFVLVYVSTPLEVCEERDRKCLYRMAREGTIPHFTGISDPYEPPDDAELAIDTAQVDPAEAVDRIVEYLVAEGYLWEEKERRGEDR